MNLLVMIFNLISLKNKPCDTQISNEYFPHNAKKELFIIGVSHRIYEKEITAQTKNMKLMALNIGSLTNTEMIM